MTYQGEHWAYSLKHWRDTHRVSQGDQLVNYIYRYIYGVTHGKPKVQHTHEANPRTYKTSVKVSTGGIIKINMGTE